MCVLQEAESLLTLTKSLEIAVVAEVNNFKFEAEMLLSFERWSGKGSSDTSCEDSIARKDSVVHDLTAWCSDELALKLNKS